MLVVREIKENFQKFVVGLNKRGLLGVEKRLKEIIELDNQRKEVQIALDETLNRSNELSYLSYIAWQTFFAIVS